MKRLLGFAVLWGALAVLACAPFWMSLPRPTDALALDSAQWIRDDSATPVSLPLARQPAGSREHYRLEFQLDEPSPRHLFIPLISQRAIVHLNGNQVDDTENRTTMVGLASGVPALIPLPSAFLREGRNVIDLHLESVGFIPGYLSQVYVGDAQELGFHYRNRVFVLEYLKLMAVAGQLLMALVVLVVWLYRPRDTLFGWLAALMLLALVTYLGVVRDLVPHLVVLMPYFMMIGSAASIVLVIVALLIAGRSPPRWLCRTSVALPLACIVVALTGLLPAQRLALLLNAPLNLVGLLVSLCIITLAALRERVREAWLLFLPLLLAFVTAVHDFLIVLRVLDGPIFLSVYYRPLLLIGFAMILMRRLGLSLGKLDDVNFYLKQRLTEQERELERLYEEERREAAQRICSEERQRLTKDLHDGLSGHLVAIIALSERERASAIEHSAREALEDLRLVIHSLDISDNELPLALSGLRERLERQLKRLGIALDWSIVKLPEISGVTPTHALNILRIIQEAVTNAIRHGRASRIVVHGSSNADDMGVITVENDGLPFPAHPPRQGRGLNNMRRRIRELGGSILVEALPNGTRLQLILPRRLPATS